MSNKIGKVLWHEHGLVPSLLIAGMVFSLLVCSFLFGSAVALADFSSSYSQTPKSMVFYFHYSDASVHVAGVDTKYLFNTTRFFRFLNDSEAYANSFYKPVGQPKMAVDFYLYPGLAGPVTVNGSWQVFVWVNASAYRQAGFDLEFEEIDSNGTILWDSGVLSPTVTSSIGSAIDVPVVNYNLTVGLDHSFSAGTTIFVEVAVGAGSASDTRIWYDSPNFSSKVILPLQDYARPLSVMTYDFNYTETSEYSAFWNDAERKVVVQANVTDPLGGYDVYLVNLTIWNVAGQKVLDNVSMARKTDGAWQTSYSSICEANWSYASTAMPGNYSVEVSVVDNNGEYSSLSSGSFEPFIEYANQSFSIGVQFAVLLRTLDAHSQPLINASVRAVSNNVVLAGGLTNDTGWWQTDLWAGYYNVSVLWQGTEVAGQPIQVADASQFTVQCGVYYPSVRIVDDVNQTLTDAEVYVTFPNGTVTVFPLYTDTGGMISLTQKPAGPYTLTAVWKGVEVQHATIVVNSDGPYNVSVRVYRLVVNVLGNDGRLVSGANVTVSAQSGVGFGVELTNSSGQSVFRLPVGTYVIDVRFSTVYWLSAVTANATDPGVLVDSSRSTDISLQDYPPAVWATVQFWLITGVTVAAVAVVVLYLLFRRRTRAVVVRQVRPADVGRPSGPTDVASRFVTTC